jgi:hypothetical protein
MRSTTGANKSAQVHLPWSRASSRKNCVVISIAESPPFLRENVRESVASFSSENVKSVEGAVNQNCQGCKHLKGCHHENLDSESLSDYAFMMEMEIDECWKCMLEFSFPYEEND